MVEFECGECNRRFGSEESLNQHMNMKHSRDSVRNEQRKFSLGLKHFFVVIVVLVVVVAGFFIYDAAASPGRYDNFAKCLASEGFIMAGTDWCSSCQTQKAMFGKSFSFVPYKDCDSEKQWCSSNGIDRYPTWVLPNGNKVTGTAQLESLSKASKECNLE